MFIDSTTNKRVNIYAPYGGFSKLDTPEIRQRAGVIEIADPVPPEDYSDDTYYRTEQDDAPYVVYTKKSDEQIAEVILAKAKQKRTADVDAITVTTLAGNTFDGDEVAQGRMARAALVMDDVELLPWVMADQYDAEGVKTNTAAIVVPVSKAELMEALRLAGAAMAAIWVGVYEELPV